MIARTLSTSWPNALIRTWPPTTKIHSIRYDSFPPFLVHLKLCVACGYCLEIKKRQKQWRPSENVSEIHCSNRFIFKSVFISSIKIVFLLLYLFLLSWDTKQTQHICNAGRNYFNYLNLLSLHCLLIGLRSCSKLSFFFEMFQLFHSNSSLTWHVFLFWHSLRWPSCPRTVLMTIGNGVLIWVELCCAFHTYFQAPESGRNYSSIASQGEFIFYSQNLQGIFQDVQDLDLFCTKIYSFSLVYFPFCLLIRHLEIVQFTMPLTICRIPQAR